MAQKDKEMAMAFDRINNLELRMNECSVSLEQIDKLMMQIAGTSSKQGANTQVNQLQNVEGNVTKLMFFKDDQTKINKTLLEGIQQVKEIDEKIVYFQKQVVKLVEGLGIVEDSFVRYQNKINELHNESAYQIIQIKTTLEVLPFMQQQIIDLEKQKTSVDDFNNFQNYCAQTYSTLEQLNEIQEGMKAFFQKFDEKAEIMDTQIKEMQNQIQDLENQQIQMEDNNVAFKQKNSQRHNSTESRIDSLWQNLEVKQKSINRIFVEIDEINKLKESKEVVESLKIRMDTFSNLESIDKLQNDFFPKVEAFSKNQNIFMKNLEDLKISIRVMDETISIKADKEQLKHYQRQVEEQYIQISDWQGVNRSLHNIQMELIQDRQNLTIEFDKLRKEQLELFDSICEDVLRTRFQMYDRVMKDFGKFFDQEELSAQMQQKASIAEMNDIKFSKASKEELNLVKQCLETFNKRLQDLSVIQSEISQVLIPFKSSINNFDEESKANFTTRACKIQSQQQIVNNIIQQNGLGELMNKFYRFERKSSDNFMNDNDSQYGKSSIAQSKIISQFLTARNDTSRHKDINFKNSMHLNSAQFSDRNQNFQNSNNQFENQVSIYNEIEYNQSIISNPKYQIPKINTKALKKKNQSESSNEKKQKSITKQAYVEKNRRNIEMFERKNCISLSMKIHPMTAMQRTNNLVTKSQRNFFRNFKKNRILLEENKESTVFSEKITK